MKHIYSIPKESGLEIIIKALEKSYNCQMGRERRWNESFFDTFGYQLYHSNYILMRKGRSFYLKSRDGKNTITGQATLKKKFFAWDLSDEGLRKEVERFSDIRALAEIVRVAIVDKSISVLNRDRKTVVRLSAEKGSIVADCEEKELSDIIVVEQIKGYEKQFARVNTILQSCNCTKLDSEGRLDCALKVCGKRAEHYSSKFVLKLDRNILVGEAVSNICLYLVNAMNVNLQGVLEDIDSEFLHDFRIAIRRTRSLLSQMKKAVPLERLNHFQTEFKWLGSITGPVRDIDVYLLMREDYRAMLPASLHGGLELFFEELEIRRRVLLKEMKVGFASPRYSALMNDWHNFLLPEGRKEQWPLGTEECVKLTSKHIRKRFSKILKDGRTIHDDSPDEYLHQLRIQGKKLRYMLEFFRSFYSQEEIDFFLKQMKKLQNNLGDFNDLSVQQDMLSMRLQGLTGRSKKSLQIAGAIGGLLTHLNEEHRKTRLKFESTFTEFASEENIERFRAMIR